MASDDDEMTNADGLRVAVGLVEPTATPYDQSNVVAEPIAKKQKAPRLSEAERLGAIGTMSRVEKTRFTRPFTHERTPALISPQPQQAAAPVVLEPRPRPAPGAMAIVGELATHERPGAKGFRHWKKYGDLPPAHTIDGVKVVAWKGIFKEVRGVVKFVEGNDGRILLISEAKIDLWDGVRIAWLARRYCQGASIRSKRAGLLYNPQVLLPPADMMRTWHTSRQIT